MKIMLELSIIVTAHDEGLLAHKTMMSVLRALDETNTEYEILIQIDNGDLATLDYFRRYADNKSFRIFQNRFSDRGKARNAAMEEARGKYLLFLDAHDLISSNYISETLKLLRVQQNNVVVSPNIVSIFGTAQKNSNCKNYQILQHVKKMPKYFLG